MQVPRLLGVGSQVVELPLGAPVVLPQRLVPRQGLLAECPVQDVLEKSQGIYFLYEKCMREGGGESFIDNKIDNIVDLFVFENYATRSSLHWIKFYVSSNFARFASHYNV